MERFDNIDIAKGIGIILVIIFHIPSLSGPGAITNVVNVFYMPLFFLISGLFFRPFHKLNDVKAIVVKKLRQLVLPSLYFYVINFVILLVALYFREGKLLFESFFYPFLGVVRISTLMPVLPWFLVALFEIFLIYSLVSLIKSRWLAGIISLLIGFAGYYVGLLPNVLGNVEMFRYMDNANYYSIGSAMLCVPFMYVGNQFRDFFLRKNIVIGIICGVVGAALIIISGGKANVSLDVMSINVIVFYISSILLTYCVVQIGYMISDSRLFSNILSYYGKNTLLVYLTHETVLIVVYSVLKSMINPIMAGIITVLVIMVVEIPIIELVNKKFKFLIGK